MRILAACLVGLLVLVIVAPVVFFGVMLLAGPHGGVLPTALHTVTLVLAWVVAIVVPLLAARRVWRRFAPPRSQGQ